MKQHLKKHAQKYVGLVLLAAAGVIVFSFTPSQPSQSSKLTDCALSTSRPCFDKQTGKNIVALESKGAENAFAACSKNATSNEYGELAQNTALCENERFEYCVEGKSKVFMRKLTGECGFGQPPAVAACPNINTFNTYGGVVDPNAPRGSVSLATVLHRENGTILAGGYRYDSTQAAVVPVIYRSIDKGITWDRVQVPPNPLDAYQAPRVSKIIAGSDGILYAGGTSFWKSTDDGVSWIFLSEPSGAYVQDLFQRSDGAFVVSTFPNPSPMSGGIEVSANGGKTWQRIVSNPQEIKDVIEANDGALVYSVIPSGYGGDVTADPGGRGVYRFINGVSTRTLPEDQLFTSIPNAPLARGADGKIYHLAFNPTGLGPGIAMDQDKSYVDAYRSDDNGLTWTKLGSLPRASLPLELIVRSATEVFGSAYSGCYNNVLYSSNNQGSMWNIVAGMQSNSDDWGYSAAYGIPLMAFSSALEDAAGRVFLPIGGIIFSNP